jgi:diphosphomevalonate decarboxylase
VRQWRAQGLPVYFTIDAGPNVHLICEAEHANEVAQRTLALPGVDHILTSGPGPAPRLVETHLF